MKFTTLTNKDIYTIIGYIHNATNKPLYIDNTLVSTIKLDKDFKYRVNSYKELLFDDINEGELVIPLDDNEIELFSKEDMLILVQTYSEFPEFNSYNVIIFNINKDKLSDIMKIIEIEKGK